MDNLELYNQSREVPQTALTTIEKGNLKGKSDINPVWRIKKLTEMFGPVGIGWYTEITREWTEPGEGKEVIFFVKLKLFIKHGGEWSKGIEGTGGNMLINDFKHAGVRNNDEALKMAETDALSVACKKLGIGADVYWEKDKTKYNNEESALQKEIKYVREEYAKLSENFKKLKAKYVELEAIKEKKPKKKTVAEQDKGFEKKILNVPENKQSKKAKDDEIDIYNQMIDASKRANYTADSLEKLTKALYQKVMTDKFTIPELIKLTNYFNIIATAIKVKVPGEEFTKYLQGKFQKNTYWQLTAEEVAELKNDLEKSLKISK